MSEHEHEWELIDGKVTQHFIEINSRRRYMDVQYFRCKCGQRGFRRLYNRVTYTWNPKPEEWIDAGQGV